MCNSVNSSNILEKEKMLRESFIQAKDNKIAELEEQVRQFRNDVNEKNEFLKKLGISSTGEFKRIRYFLEELRTENSKLREHITQQDVEIQNLKSALSAKEAE